LEAYRRHPFRRRNSARRVIWREGTTRLLDYGGDAGAPVVLVVPSLINRYYILDILPERSFLQHLVDQGLRPLVVDWQAPGGRERHFDLTTYVVGRLERVFGAVAEIAAAPIAIVGYCMGGLLALALALRHQNDVRCLALLATPWDFHAERSELARVLGRVAGLAAGLGSPTGTISVELIQYLFFMLDPFTAKRKFTHFAMLDRDGDEARTFVALEDWVNDGVPLALPAARECASSWYDANLPGRGLWQIGGQLVDPKLLDRPALVVIPSRDRLVAPGSAEPLASALGAATVLRPSLGHVGMMSAARAPASLWTPIGAWLRAHLAG
jgi:polyhydroxyalkanoate synthase